MIDIAVKITILIDTIICIVLFLIISQGIRDEDIKTGVAYFFVILVLNWAMLIVK